MNARPVAWPAAVAVLAGCLSGCAAETSGQQTASSGRAWHFVSRPDLTPPVLDVDGAVPDGDGEFVFLGPKGDDVPLTGVLVVDGAGDPVYVLPTGYNVNDVRVQQYEGAPVLTFWRGSPGAGVMPGLGRGEFVVLDEHYRQVATVTTGGSIGPGEADLHEGRITAAGTMLLTAYPPVRADLTAVGGPAAGWTYDGVVQEVDIATGELLFEWRASDHVPISDSTAPLGTAGTRDHPYDWFHVNGVSEDTDGSLLVSARNTSAVYDVDRGSGEVVWTLGGRSGDFTMGAGTTFAWQHDAERQPDGTLTLYDNESEPAALDHSRGLRLALDTATRSARLVQEYLPPDGRRSSSQGSVEVLPDGEVLVGWGSEPRYSLFTGDGDLLADVGLGQGTTSYRAHPGAWTGTPDDPPDLALRTGGGATTAYVSWNGATGVRSWRLRAGDSGVDAPVAGTVDPTGFETALDVPRGARYVVVEALDGDGRVLGSAGAPVP